MTKKQEEMVYQLNSKLSTISHLDRLFIKSTGKQRKLFDQMLAERFMSAMEISRQLRGIFDQVHQLATQQGMYLVVSHIEWVKESKPSHRG